MSDNLIEEFVEKKSLDAMDTMLVASEIDKVAEAAVQLADTFNGLGDGFRPIAENSDNAEEKLISSFKNNIILLIQKTWIEKSDEDLKTEVLNQVQDFLSHLSQKDYIDSFKLFLEIVNTTVYLMFGSQTKSKDFNDYALRIDPEFGLFWWYIKSLPTDASWTPEKKRIAILLGMYFLANY